jgi:signal peptidase II
VARIRGWALALATVGVVVLLDQATKAAAIAHLQRGEHDNIFFGLELTNSRNRGVAFGALSGGGVVVVAAIALALVALIAYFAMNANRPLLWLPVGMLLGGAIGNLADRARVGAVIDFIDPMWWPAFNLADASIVLGVLVLLYAIEAPRRKE